MNLRHSPVAFMVGSVTCLICASFLLLLHARKIRDVSEEALPMAAELPVLEGREKFLKEQIEVAELHAQLRNGSDSERISAFVLPKELDIDRGLALFDILRAHLQRMDALRSLSSVEFEDSIAGEDGITAHPFSLEMVVTEEGAKKALGLFSLAGYLTVADALTQEEIDSLMKRSDQENPAGITSLERFLGTDLLRYVLEPKLFEEGLLGAYTSAGFADALQRITRGPSLTQAKEVLGLGLAQVLEQEKLWPLPFIKTSNIETKQDGVWYTISLKGAFYTAD